MAHEKARGLDAARAHGYSASASKACTSLLIYEISLKMPPCANNSLVIL